MAASNGWKRLWSSHWRTAMFAAGGALVGLAYYQFIGCRAGGTCAITSSPWRSAIFFAFTGAVAGFPSPGPAKRSEQPPASR